METTAKKPQSKHLGTLILLAGLLVAVILTPWFMGIQEDASLNRSQLEQQYNSLVSTLNARGQDLQEYNEKSAVEKTKVIGAIPEPGKASQAQILREIEGILSGTNANLRTISFENSTFSEGAGPKALPVNIEITSPDAATILQILKKFEGATRLYQESNMTLTSAESSVTAMLRFHVYSRE